MRIKGPTDGSKPPEAVDEAGAAEGVDEVAPTDAPQVSGVAGPSAATGAASADAIGQVAARLRAGQITVDQAVEELIDDAIRRQVGKVVVAQKDLEPKLRELLRSYAASDPYLTAKIRRLTQPK